MSGDSLSCRLSVKRVAVCIDVTRDSKRRAWAVVKGKHTPHSEDDADAREESMDIDFKDANNESIVSIFISGAMLSLVRKSKSGALVYLI